MKSSGVSRPNAMLYVKGRREVRYEIIRSQYKKFVRDV